MDRKEMSYFLWNYIFGSLSEGEIATIVLSIKTISSILVFLFLFGNCIAKYFSDVANVYFVRVRSRKCWTSKKLMIVGMCAFLYVVLFVLVEMVLYSIQVEEAVMDAEILPTAFTIVGILVPILIVLTILVNGIAIKWGISVGITAAAVLTVTLEVLAIIAYNHIVNIVLNPFCFNVYLLEDNQAVLYKIITNCIYVGFAVSSFIGYIDLLDIWGKEN